MIIYTQKSKLEFEYHYKMLLEKMYEEGCCAPNFWNMYDTTLLMNTIKLHIYEVEKWEKRRKG